VTHPELKVQRGEAPIVRAEELAALLPDASSALLEYVVGDEKTYLFVVTKGSKEADVRVYTLPIKRDDLAKQTEAFRQQLASRNLGFRASAAKLYEQLLKPAVAQLSGRTGAHAKLPPCSARTAPEASSASYSAGATPAALRTCCVCSPSAAGGRISGLSRTAARPQIVG